MNRETPLIKTLSRDLTARPWYAPLRMRISLWVLCAVVLVAVPTTLLPGPPLWMLVDTTFVIQTSVFFVLGIVSGIAGLTLSVPAERVPRSMVWLWLLCAALGLMLVFVISPQDLTELADHSHDAASCAAGNMQFAFLPAVFGLWLLHKGAALEARLPAFLVLLGAGFLGTTALQFSCTNQQPLHVLFAHMLPAILIGFIGLVLGGSILSWGRRVRGKQLK